MTYRELAKEIEAMKREQQDCDVSIVLLDTQESIPVIDFVWNWVSPGDNPEYDDEDIALGIDIVDGVLDEGHPYITIDW